MTKNELIDLKKMYVGLSAYYQKETADLTIEMYVRDLENYSFQEILRAIEKYRRNPKNKTIPLPANLIEIINPEINSKDIGQIVSAQLQKALTKKGSWWGVNMDTDKFKEEMREYLGDIGFTLIQKIGGWSVFCNRAREANMDIFNSQIRELAISLHKMKSIGVDIETEKFMEIKKSHETIENERRRLLSEQQKQLNESKQWK